MNNQGVKQKNRINMEHGENRDELSVKILKEFSAKIDRIAELQRQYIELLKEET